MKKLSKIASLALTVGLGLTGCVNDSEKPLDKSFVKTSSGTHIVSEFDDRYVIERTGEPLPTWVQTMISYGKDGTLEEPSDQTHKGIYEDIYVSLVNQ